MCSLCDLDMKVSVHVNGRVSELIQLLKGAHEHSVQAHVDLSLGVWGGGGGVSTLNRLRINMLEPAHCGDVHVERGGAQIPLPQAHKHMHTYPSTH